MNIKQAYSHVPGIIATLLMTLIAGSVHAEGSKNAVAHKRISAPPATTKFYDASSPYLAVTGKEAPPKPGDGKTAANFRQDKLGNFEIQDIKSPRDSASGQATGIMVCNGGPCFNPADTERKSP